MMQTGILKKNLLKISLMADLILKDKLRIKSLPDDRKRRAVSKIFSIQNSLMLEKEYSSF